MNILFISEILPVNSSASAVIFYRHLSRLVDEGHDVHVLTDGNSFERKFRRVSEKFRIHPIPNRKWYYPPYKTSGRLQKIRFASYYREHVKSLIKEQKIDLLIANVFGEFLSPFAAYVKERTGLPLITFFHDDPLQLNFYRSKKTVFTNTSNLLKASDKVLTVSEGFVENWKQFSAKFELLYPIPEPITAGVLPKAKNGKLCFGYAGEVYNEIIEPLENISTLIDKEGYHFKIIGNNPRVDYLQDKFERVECKPMFEVPGQAIEYLLKNVDACVVPYPDDWKNMPWIKTCFPSKFIQYCQLGIPTIIVAPEESALGQWCKKHKWILFSNNYNASVMEFAKSGKLHSVEVKEQVSYFRNFVFNPDHIHEQFVKIINEVVQNHD